MVDVKDIFIEGFASITEPILYNFEQHGINIILGKNGAGKSTVYNALTWVLYGTTIKGKIDIETWDDVKPEDYKGTYVHVTMTIDGKAFSIHRFQKYKGKAVDGLRGKSRLMVYEDGVLYEKKKDKRDLQAYINKRLGMSYRLFKNAIIFGQKLSRLLKDGGVEQKKVLDELFDTVFIDKAKKKVDQTLHDLFIEQTKIRNKFDNLENEKNLLMEQLDVRLEEKANFAKNKKMRVKAINTEISELVFKIDDASTGKKEHREYKLKIVDTQAKILKIVNVNKEYEEAKSKAFKLQMEMGNKRNAMCDATDLLKKNRKDFKDIKKTCTTCGQPLDKASIKITKDNLLEKGHEIHKQAKDAEKAFLKVETQYQKADSSERKLDEQNHHYNNLNKELERLNGLLYKSPYNPELVEQLKENRKEKEKKIKTIGAEKFSFDFKELQDKISKKTVRLKVINKKINRLHKKQNNLNWLIKQPLSNSGLKTFIFSAMLDEVNINLERYAEVLGFGVLFEIDLDSAYKNLKAHIFQDEQITDYDNLSGGEQQLVDIAVAFSIHDVIAKDNNFNILLMDEIFESLDNDNIDLITDLIVTKSENVFVHLVTHLSEFRPSNCNITTFVKGSQKNTIVL